MSKELIAGIATGIAIISYAPYIRDILLKKTKPHAFSWFVWSTLVVITLIAQIMGDAGPAAFVTGFTAVVCYFIFFISLKYSKLNIAKSDWVPLIMAGLAIVGWLISRSPVVAVIMVTLADILGFIPTLRKSYFHPWDETVSTYVLNVVKHFISLFALSTVSLTTALYPAYLVIANMVLVGFLMVRRKVLSSSLTQERSVKI